MNIRKLTTRQLLEQVWLDLLKATNFRMPNYRVNTDHTYTDVLDILLFFNVVQINTKACGTFVDSKILAIVMER